MNCPVCKNIANLFCHKGNYKIYRCDNCGFGVTSGLDAQDGNYHRDETYIEEESLFKNIFQKRVDIIKKFKTKGKILEIGCSTGLMLSLFQKKDFQVEGVEISEQSSKLANSRGIKIYNDFFENIKFTKKYDLIILNHTLEHLKDSSKVLEKIYQLLNKDGTLYIDVPNFGSLTANIQKCDWPLLLPEEHLWHYTEDSLRILLSQEKFKIIFCEKASGLWDFSSPVNEIFSSLINLKKRFFKEIITAIPSYFISKTGLGTDLMIIAKKL